MYSGEEKRKHKRVALHVPVECRSGQATCTCQIENISISGLLIRTETAFAQFEEIVVRFRMPDAGPVIEASARVAHTVPGSFMGIEFISLPLGPAAAIETYVADAPALQAKAVNRGH